MGSLDRAFFDGLTADELMIKIWEFSEHVHHTPPPDLTSCNCGNYLQMCIDAARDKWQDNYIYLTCLKKAL